jgi:hypothetical protein
MRESRPDAGATKGGRDGLWRGSDASLDLLRAEETAEPGRWNGQEDCDDPIPQGGNVWKGDHRPDGEHGLNRAHCHGVLRWAAAREVSRHVAASYDAQRCVEKHKHGCREVVSYGGVVWQRVGEHSREQRIDGSFDREGSDRQYDNTRQNRKHAANHGAGVYRTRRTLS